MHSSFDFHNSRARVLIREKTVATILTIAATALFLFGIQMNGVVEAQQQSGLPYAAANSANSSGVPYQKPYSGNPQSESATSIPSANEQVNLLMQSEGVNDFTAFQQPSSTGSIPQQSTLSNGANAQSGLQTCTFCVTWTGPNHIWRGQIEVLNPSGSTVYGSVTEASSLGIEADQAAAYSVQQGVLYIHHTSARAYDGYTLSVTGYQGCKIRITLSTDNKESKRFDINWEDLFYQPIQFDAFDAKVILRRTSGDYLRLNVNRDNLVFSPGETFTAKLTPYKLAAEGLTDYNPAIIKVRLQHTRENFVVYKNEYTWTPETGGDILLNIPLPSEEGVYDVIITASCSKTGPILSRVTGAVNKQLENAHLKAPRTLATRKVQLVIFDSTPEQAEQSEPLETRLTAEIDPANPRWWEPLERLSQLPLGLGGKQWEYPLGNGTARVLKCELGSVTELAANRPGENPSWEAYTFPVERIGTPHILEIEYPSDSEQTTGISIIEPNAAGAITSGAIDSGFHISADSLLTQDRPSWKTHKIVFWPRTKSPVVVIYNLREDVVSRYGKIRIMSVVDKLPPMYSGTAPRLLAAYLDRPQFPAMFSAKKTATENANMVLDSWETFYDGATRMTEYLNFVGYNGAMISVNSDGSAIWPCPELAPTPLYDTGIFSQSCADPIRKDALELLMRVFDRQKMRFIPAIEMAQPVPALEAKIRNNNPQTSGLQWVGPNGKTILSAYPPENGAAMYYNILHPDVQQFVLDLVSHLTFRYKNHPSFTGLGLQLTDNSWLVLPPPQWGMDDETIRRFTADTGIRVPGEGVQRFQQRARYLTGPALAHWLKWRSDKLAEFYCKLRDRIQADGGNRKLYLSGAKLFTRCHQNVLLPRLPQTVSIEYAMLQCGLGADYGLGAKHDIVLMYTQRVINGQTLGKSAADRQWKTLPNIDAFFSSRSGQRIQASLFFHPVHSVQLTDFEKKSPYKPTYAFLKSIPTPAGIENRSRFIQSLAKWDTQEFFDGGWTLALGEEESVVNTIAAIRCLAYRPYNQTVGSRQEAVGGEAPQSQAIVCRWLSDGLSTWAYAVNTTPYRIAGKIKLDASFNGTTPPAGLRLDNVLNRFSEQNNKGSDYIDNIPKLTYENNQLVWQSSFAPFEVQIVKFNAPLQPQSPIAIWSPQTIDQMRKSLTDLINRANALRSAKAMRILDNPDFELPANGSQPIPQWIIWKHPNQPESSSSGATIDYRDAVNGRGSLHLVCDGWPTALYSKEISTEATGRFTISVWLKKDPNIPLKCFISGKCGGRNVYQETRFCQGSNNAVIAQQGEWQQFYFHINNLPLESVDNLRIGFELSQQGEAWIDNISISDLYFSEYEQQELFKSMRPINDKFAQGELEYCWQYQQSYWPQFLMNCVELRSFPSAPTTATTAPYNNAVGHSASSFGAVSNQPSVTQTPSAAPPVQVSGHQRKKLFNFGKPSNESIQTPNQSAPPNNAKKEPEQKSFWQNVTDLFKWK